MQNLKQRQGRLLDLNNVELYHLLETAIEWCNLKDWLQDQKLLEILQSWLTHKGVENYIMG